MAFKVYRSEIVSAPDGPELAAALEQLPSWRLQKALSYRRDIDRYLCAKAYLLLRDGLAEMFGITESISFEYSASGKPRLKGYPDVHFNISHCPRCVCCIVADRPAGIDVEELQYDPELAASVLNASEMASVQQSLRPEVEFTRLWTMKEALVKMTGEGLRDNMKNILSGCTPDFEMETNEASGYVLCSAVMRQICTTS